MEFQKLLFGCSKSVSRFGGLDLFSLLCIWNYKFAFVVMEMEERKEIDLSVLQTGDFDEVEACLVDWSIRHHRVNELFAAASELLGRMNKSDAERIMDVMRTTSGNFRDAIDSVTIVS